MKNKNYFWLSLVLSLSGCGYPRWGSENKRPRSVEKPSRNYTLQDYRQIKATFEAELEPQSALGTYKVRLRWKDQTLLKGGVPLYLYRAQKNGLSMIRFITPDTDSFTYSDGPFYGPEKLIYTLSPSVLSEAFVRFVGQTVEIPQDLSIRESITLSSLSKNLNSESLNFDPLTKIWHLRLGRLSLGSKATLMAEGQALQLQAQQLRASAGAQIVSFPLGQRAAQARPGRHARWIALDLHEGIGELRVRVAGEEAGKVSHWRDRTRSVGGNAAVIILRLAQSQNLRLIPELEGGAGIRSGKKGRLCFLPIQRKSLEPCLRSR